MMVPKRHGMVDKKWTLKDKITQYKGLVKLSERDAKLLQIDKRITERKQNKELHQLKKDIAVHRKELINAIKGDQQQLKNTLRGHQNLKRTFQDHLPEKTLEFIEHKNFNQRKMMDRLECKTKKKLRELIEQKLICGDIQNNSMVTNKTNVETMSEIISGKIQDANIKLEAALQINHVYKQILEVMKKDKINYDAVLDQLLKDSYHQSKCIYQATQIGQLAIEYTDDRKQELELLRRAVKRDMKSRMLQIHIAEQQVKATQDSLKFLVQKESTPKVDNRNEEVNQENQLQQDLHNLEKLLSHLQNVTCTSKFEDILPCIQERHHKSKQMGDMLRKSVNEKEALHNKIKHAQSMYSHLANTTEFSTFEYMQKKIISRQKLGDVRTKVEKLKNTLEKKKKLAMNIQSIMLHLQQLCKIINIPNKLKEGDQMYSDIGLIYMPEQPERDVLKIMNELDMRLSILMNNTSDDDMLNLSPDINTVRCFQKFISHICRKVPEEQFILNDGLVMEIELKDAKILTREFIKKQSQHIVDQNAKPEWML